MPRLAPITGTPDVSAEHHAVVDAAVNAFEVSPPPDGDRLPA